MSDKPPEQIYNSLNRLLQPELTTMTGDEFVTFLRKCFAEIERREFVQHHDCRIPASESHRYITCQWCRGDGCEPTQESSE